MISILLQVLQIALQYLLTKFLRYSNFQYETALKGISQNTKQKQNKKVSYYYSGKDSYSYEHNIQLSLFRWERNMSGICLQIKLHK